MATRYEEIADDLRGRISKGGFPAGSTLPGYDQLVREYGTSRGTIREALKLLEVEGIVRPIKKKGLVIRDPGERRRVARGTAVRRGLRGYIFPGAATPDEPWLIEGRTATTAAPVPDSVAALFGIEAGSENVRRRVTSRAGTTPFQITDVWVHPEVLAEAPRVGSPAPGCLETYLDRIEEAGHGPLEWEERTRVRLPSREEAKLLEIPSAMPVFEVTTVGTSHRTGRPTEASVRVIPGDRVEFVTKLRRDRTARWPTGPTTDSAPSP
ncbi:GntR family transcriptional regulator [Streptomyces goshikiensis]|uniref:GntR family transcriptional regulator n=1 Tax=Streptomyces goshikiensis TaxID=1942 RepID=UPI0037B80E30